MKDNSEGRADTHGTREDSGTDEPPKRGVRGWLTDLFTGDSDELSELTEGLRDAAGRGLGRVHERAARRGDGFCSARKGVGHALVRLRGSVVALRLRTALEGGGVVAEVRPDGGEGTKAGE